MLRSKRATNRGRRHSRPRERFIASGGASVGAGAALLVFELDAQRFGLPLTRAARIIQAVSVTPLPGAPAIVLGVVDIAGAVLPVIDMRRRFGRAPRAIQLSDQLVLADTGRRPVALLVDAATAVVDAPAEDLAAGDALLPGLGPVDGALMLADGLVLISDLDRLLSLDEEAALDGAMAAAASDAPEDPQG